MFSRSFSGEWGAPGGGERETGDRGGGEKGPPGQSGGDKGWENCRTVRGRASFLSLRGHSPSCHGDLSCYCVWKLATDKMHGQKKNRVF